MKRQTLLLFAIALCLQAPGPLCASDGDAAGTLRGVVVDESGEPVKGATVTVLSLSGAVLAAVETRDDGGFLLEAFLSLDGSTVRAEREGFLPARAPAPRSTDERLELRLRALTHAHRVSVVALRQERELFDTPQAVSIVTAQDIEAQGLTNLPAALEGLPGVQVQRTDAGGGSPYLRGLIGNRVLVLVDGVRLNNSTFRLGPNQYLNTIDPSSVRRIEVVRGPSSSLHGSDGLGGVINIVSKTPAASPQARLRLGYDTAADAPTVTAEVSERFGPVGVLAQVTGVNYDDLEGGSDTGVQSPTGYNRRAADLKLSMDLGDLRSLTLAGQYLDADDVPRFDRIDSGKNEEFRFDPQSRALGYLRYRDEATGFLGASSMEATVSWMEQTEGRTIRRTGSSVESSERDEVDTYGLTFQADWSEWKRQQWLGGIEVYRDSVSSSRVLEDLSTGVKQSARGRFPDGAHYRSLALFTQTVIRAGSRLELILGGRYSRFDVDAFLEELDFDYNASFEDLTGSANFLLSLTPHVRLTGGVSEGFRAPGLDDATVFGEFNAGIEVPSTDLSPEKITNYELSLRILTRRFWASATIFDSFLSDLIERVPSTFRGLPTLEGEDVFQRRNTGRAELYGAEIQLQASPVERFTLSFSLATFRGTNTSTGEPLRRIPPLAGRLGARWYLLNRTSWLELTTDFADRQDRLSPGDIGDTRIPEDGTPGYGVVSLGAGFDRADGWGGSVVLYNIGDADYRVHGSGINGPGRSLRLALHRRFNWRAR